MSLDVYCHSHGTHKQRSTLDIKDIRDNYGLLAVGLTRMSSSIEHAIIKPKLGYHVTTRPSILVLILLVINSN